MIIVFRSNLHQADQERTEVGILSACPKSLEAIRGTLAGFGQG